MDRKGNEPGGVVVHRTTSAGCSLIPLPRQRAWMTDSPGAFAYRCLPLAIANQAGWGITLSRGFSAKWTGGASAASVRVYFDDDGQTVFPAQTEFGNGILTLEVPYLFRTPPGVALWVRGLPNSPKAGCWPLEGIVETDWSSMTFTMNYQLTVTDEWVRFERGDIYCAVTPIRLDLLESLSLSFSEPDDATCRRLQRWSDERARTNSENRLHGRAGQPMTRSPYQMDYFRGRHADGSPAETPHRRKLTLSTPQAPPDPEPQSGG